MRDENDEEIAWLHANMKYWRQTYSKIVDEIEERVTELTAGTKFQIVTRSTRNKKCAREPTNKVQAFKIEKIE